MDQFYLKNVALYQNLVDAFHPPPSMTSAAFSKSAPPEMVVSARIRPFLQEDIASGFPCAVYPRAVSSRVVDIHDLYNHPRGRPILKSFNYKVDKVFTPEVTTEQIYQDLVANLLPFVRSGGVGTVFAYGQTGSGKTFTISKLEQLAIQSLTNSSSSNSNTSSSLRPLEIQLTIIELAGNSAFDLLTSRKPISILEDSSGTIHLSGAAEHTIPTLSSALSLIDLASSFRRTESTLKNDASSRSHSICRIRISNHSTGTEGFLYLVDLAGSEAARDVASHGAERMRETKEINMSLSVLKDCIRGRAEWDGYSRLREGKKGRKVAPRIPFRQSALTKVLKHIFETGGGSGTVKEEGTGGGTGRACKTVVIACVNPSLGDVAATKNTLRYAEMLRVNVPVVGTAGDKVEGPMGWGNKQVREWILKESGDVPISPEILAPTESGAEVLRISALEFEYRCSKSPGVTLEHAKALRLKLWKLHAES
ncbi:P-loop containing nucleoside triphosphate hydrolase protein [Immersiella caudata]|uniref:P-loop containing nucleoside triphosphate hydrolase protein n=1 Tax=Immersiella caudata TaxID=314043 RepID=A0AA39TYX9_9PEZI|nr:P-loop containing nucleoside triphosphate hydrolase protein [Immersiella caudata]